MQAVQDGGSEHRLQDEISRLQSAMHFNSLMEIRAGVRRSLESLSGCVEQLRREKDSVIAQLKDEIRTLHRAAEQTRHVAEVDPTTGVHKREEFVKLVRREIVASRAIGVVHILVRNLHEMSGSHSSSVVDQLLVAFCKRLRNVAPLDATLSRWTSDAFCIVLQAAHAQKVAAEVLGSCAGRYSCMEGGVSRTLYIQVQTTCAYPQSHEDPDDFLRKLENLHAKS
jgi:GGDEF domain-containing protein